MKRRAKSKSPLPMKHDLDFAKVMRKYATALERGKCFVERVNVSPEVIDTAMNGYPIQVARAQVVTFVLKFPVHMRRAKR